MSTPTTFKIIPSNWRTPLLALSLSATILSFAGCCCPSGRSPFVAVRERQFRTEESAADRLALPLDAAATNAITSFLSARGIVPRPGEMAEIRDPGAAERYRPLLVALQNTNHLSVEDVTTRKTFAKWLRYPGIQQIIDARELKPLFPRPVALTDGLYWWIFYPDRQNDRLTHLLIFRSQVDPQKR